MNPRYAHGDSEAERINRALTRRDPWGHASRGWRATVAATLNGTLIVAVWSSLNIHPDVRSMVIKLDTHSL